MKNFFLLLVIFFSLSATAQQVEQIGSKFFINGEQVPSYELKQKMKDTDYTAYANFKSYSNKTSWGGFLLGLGGGLIVADVVVGLVSDVTYPTPMTYVGAACAVGSIPVLMGRKKKLTKAIDTYNEAIKENKTSFKNNFELNVVSNSRGLGLQLNF